MKEFIKKVATGPKGNEDLTLQEAECMMRLLLSNDVSDVEKTAFLVGWRLKPETIEEYRGALSVIVEKTKKKNVQNSFELGFPFDGKNDSPYLFPLIGKILKTEGVHLVVTGDERVPAKNGITVKMLHQKLHEREFKQDYEYFDRRDYLPQLSQLTGLRNLIGLRTALNTLEKFSLVAESQFAATGVFHKPYVEKYASIFEDRLKRFLLISGNEGSPEIAKKSKYWIISEGKRDEYLVDPLDFGIEAINRDEVYSLEEQLSIVVDPPKNVWSMACLNAAIYLDIIRPQSNSSTIKDNYDLLIGKKI